MMPQLLEIALTLLLLAAPSPRSEACADQDKTIIGFSAGGSVEQRRLERLLFDWIKPEGCSEILKNLTMEPNMAGTPGDRRNAEYVADYFRGLGLDTSTYEYVVYLPYCKAAEVILPAAAGGQPTVLCSREVGVEEDPQSAWKFDTPPYNAYSPSADVSAPLVYANYGLAADYETLAEQGIDVQGKMVLVRYGGAYRGTKAWEAQRRGVAAMILYSDPADDGYRVGLPYPEGRMRPPDAPQRGSVLFIFNAPGDPLTPLEPSLPDARRIDPAEADLPRVPTMPLSYRDAELLLGILGGPECPPGWQGGLALRYRLGPSAGEVRVRIDMDYENRSIWDVIGILPGEESPEQLVLVGCHRDAWTYGAMDPHSGNAVILEAARALAEAAHRGYRPRRSIAFCSWDAEEFGSLGSVEWVEQHREMLTRSAVAYINGDAMISGSSFWAAATPTLRPVLQDLLAEIRDPEHRTIREVWMERIIRSGREAPTELPFGLLGGGSDHAGFLNHAGVPCISYGFGGGQGVYHSSYDTFRFMEVFGDPEFKYHATGARLTAALLSRLAGAAVLPISPSRYAPEIRAYLQELDSSAEQPALGAEKALDQLLTEIEGLGLALEREIKELLERGDATGESLGRINDTLLRLERCFVDERGIPGRPWYRHVLYASDLKNGYAVLKLPGLQVAREQFNEQLDRFRLRLMCFRDAVAAALATAIPARGESAKQDVGP